MLKVVKFRLLHVVHSHASDRISANVCLRSLWIHLLRGNWPIRTECAHWEGRLKD